MGLTQVTAAESRELAGNARLAAEWKSAHILWPSLVAVIGLWAAAYSHQLMQMARIWFEGGDMVHGPVVPFAAGYMAWTRRRELAKLKVRSSGWGLALVVWSALQAVVSLVADWRFPGFLTVWLSLVGAILFLYGLPAIRVLFYPLVVLLLMIPPPSFLYDRLTLNLQLVSSALSEKALESIGYSVLREGNILEMMGERLSVAEACSGIRALIALVFFCSVYTFFFVTSRRLKIALWIATVPFAILGNTLRIVLTGIAGQYNRAFLHGGLHETMGYVTVFFAGLLCIGFHSLCERMMGLSAERRQRSV